MTRFTSSLKFRAFLKQKFRWLEYIAQASAICFSSALINFLFYFMGAIFVIKNLEFADTKRVCIKISTYLSKNYNEDIIKNINLINKQQKN